MTTRVELYETALRDIAALVIRARATTTGMGQLPRGGGESLMCDVEHVLTSLIVLGAAPPVLERPVLDGTPWGDYPRQDL